MKYDEWAPIYERIRNDFGYDESEDVRARDVLAGYARPFDLRRLDVAGEPVAIAGGADSLENDRQIAAEASSVFAASTATDTLTDAGIDVDVMVTDLDKNPATAVRRTRAGRPVAVHAHGDNIEMIREWLPKMDPSHVLATTQVEPVAGVRNFGGFTDGDRAAFLADHLGAGALRFPGWDFDDETVSSEKRSKLAWAERLLAYLERRRDERFPVLDGRRDHIDTAQDGELR